MVRYRVLRPADIPEIQPVALKAWMFAYPRYGVPVSTIQRFVRERYSTESFQRYVLPSIQKGHFPGFTSQQTRQRSSVTPTLVLMQGLKITDLRRRPALWRSRFQ